MGAAPVGVPKELESLMKWGWDNKVGTPICGFLVKKMFSWSPYPLKVFFEEKIVNLE